MVGTYVGASGGTAARFAAGCDKRLNPAVRELALRSNQTKTRPQGSELCLVHPEGLEPPT